MVDRPYLHLSFLIDKYELSFKYSSSDKSVFGLLRIMGSKTGKPSKRITLHQKGLKILTAEIIYERKQKIFNYQIARINRVKSFEEVRLHTKEIMYPGPYTINLTFKSKRPLEDYQKITNLDASELSKLALRNYFSSIDEPEARENAEFKLVYINGGEK